MTALNNFEIENLAKLLKIKYFRGVFMRDTLPNKINNKECGIVNLDSIKNDGTHWVCYYKNNDYKVYFDSFGLDPPFEIQSYMGDNIFLSTFQIQEFNTEHCGQLCLYILYEIINNNKVFEKIIMKLK